MGQQILRFVHGVANRDKHKRSSKGIPLVDGIAAGVRTGPNQGCSVLEREIHVSGRRLENVACTLAVMLLSQEPFVPSIKSI